MVVEEDSVDGGGERVLMFSEIEFMMTAEAGRIAVATPKGDTAFGERVKTVSAVPAIVGHLLTEVKVTKLCK